MASTFSVAAEREMVTTASDSERLKSAVLAHYGGVWRSVRRLGASASDADDIAQEVFFIFSRRLDDVEPSSEKRFLFRTAFRALLQSRRSFSRRREDIDEEIEQHHDSAPSPEEQTVERERLATLDRLLQQLPFELRTVLTLCAIEQVTMRDAAEILEVPTGTIASRLARARERMEEIVRRERARGEP
jgi:RNA polymerase sigma-70 factor (ECF subfamily)